MAVRQLRADGRSVPDELLAHISPGHSDNINFFGVINVDIEVLAVRNLALPTAVRNCLETSPITKCNWTLDLVRS